MTATRRAVSWAMLPLALIASLGVCACTNIVQQADGSYLASMGGQRVVIPASVAAGVAGALSENGNAPQGLESAMQAIVAENAGGAGDVMLAVAIAELAVCDSSGDSNIVTAIVDGTTQGNPSVTPEAALSAVAAAAPATPAASTQRSQDTQDTVEDPAANVSPV